MKKASIFLSTILLLVTSFVMNACDNDNHNNLNADLKFRLLNEIGEETTTFKQGENIFFSFLIINHSSQDIYLKHGKVNTNDFFKIKKTIPNSEGVLEIGKPYKTIFCTYEAGKVVPANDTLKIEIPWVVPENFRSSDFCTIEHNNYLNIGSYITEFSSDFEFFYADKELNMGNKSFKINFNVN